MSPIASKSERGLVSQPLYAAEYQLVGVMFGPPITVLAGKDTPIPVKVLALPPNASIERVVATLAVADASGTPAQTNVGVEIKKDGKPNDPASGRFAVAVDEPTRPRNVELRLGGGEPFWSFGGVLTADEYDLPDMAVAVNAYLDAARLEAPLAELPFVLRSDTSGRVGIDITELTYSQVKTQWWPNPLDGTARIDRNLALDFGAVERLVLDPLIEPPRPVQLRALRLDVAGQFGPDRLLGDAEAHYGREFATISAEYALAQSVRVSDTLVKEPCRCSGVACLLSGDAEAEVYVELQADEDGRPAAAPPLAKCNLSFTPAPAGTVPRWTLAPFAVPAELKTATPYWIVVKGVRGAVWLWLRPAGAAGGSAAPMEHGAIHLSRGGQLWKPMFRHDPTSRAALLGLVYLPGEDDQTAAIRLLAAGAPASAEPAVTRLDPDKAAATVSLDLPAGVDWNQLVLEVHAYAQGTLTIANVIREYRVA